MKSKGKRMGVMLGLMSFISLLTMTLNVAAEGGIEEGWNWWVGLGWMALFIAVFIAIILYVMWYESHKQLVTIGIIASLAMGIFAVTGVTMTSDSATNGDGATVTGDFGWETTPQNTDQTGVCYLTSTDDFVWDVDLNYTTPAAVDADDTITFNFTVARTDTLSDPAYLTVAIDEIGETNNATSGVSDIAVISKNTNSQWQITWTDDQSNSHANIDHISVPAGQQGSTYARTFTVQVNVTINAASLLALNTGGSTSFDIHFYDADGTYDEVYDVTVRANSKTA